MTLKEIKTMFTPGQQWRVVRESPTIIIQGNITGAAIHNKEPDTIRTIKQLKSAELVTTLPDGRSIHATWPKATDILEARPGYLKFQYWRGQSHPGPILTFTLMPSLQQAA